jgi:ribosomal protein S18 acetylase RimI-like enzyme
MECIIRHIQPVEWPLIEGFLFGAIFLPPDFTGQINRSIIEHDPKCRAAWEGFGTLDDDRCFVAVVDDHVVGACWVRTTDEYGHIDESTPSFSISLLEPYRGRGMGSALMKAMLEELRQTGYARASLSVQKENPAFRMYRRLGFNIIGDGADETEWLMVTDLTDNGIHTATPDDADAICNLIQQAIATSRRECRSPADTQALPHENDRRTIETDIARGRVRVLKDGDRIVGIGTLTENRITFVFAAPTEQGKGIGTRIMDALEKAAVPSGKVYLDAPIQCRDFFLHRGYEPDDEQTHEVRPAYGLPTAPSETLAKRLT